MNRLVDRFIAVSEATRTKQITYTGQSRDKTVVIPNGVELEHYENLPDGTRIRLRNTLGISDDAFVVGSVARLIPQKGLGYLIAALPELIRRVPNLCVLLVGEGPLRCSLHKQAGSLGVGGHVHFVGHQTDVAGYLSAMDLFVLPSLWEGLPLAVLEAMAAGLPVVATAVDGTPEAVEDGVTGRLVAPRDPHALASAILDILEDRGQAALMGSRGRARSERFRQDSMVDRVDGVYKAALRA